VSLSAYIAAAMAQARYKLLEDRSFFGEIPPCRGVWANEKTLEKCRRALQEVLEDWIVLKLRDRESLPAIHGKTLTVPEDAPA
jgi:predicted RNase H-like HicB family nuclease